MESDIHEVFEEMERYIRGRVASGFYSSEEIERDSVEIFADEADSQLLEPRAKEFALTAIEAHLQEQSSWPAVTDCDRLDEAFAELEKEGIVSRQDFSCCGTCGAAEIGDEIDDVTSVGKVVRGYTFYHQQDTEAAVDGYGVCLNYGSVEEGETAALEIAREIVSVLSKHQLSVSWNGSWDNRIQVALDWKRRLRAHS